MTLCVTLQPSIEARLFKWHDAWTNKIFSFGVTNLIVSSDRLLLAFFLLADIPRSSVSSGEGSHHDGQEFRRHREARVLREIEALYTRDDSQCILHGVVDEHIGDATQCSKLLFTADIRDGNLHVHFHGENGHLFHSMHAALRVDVTLVDGAHVVRDVDLGSLPPRILALLRLRHGHCVDKDVVVPLNLPFNLIHSFRMIPTCSDQMHPMRSPSSIVKVRG